MIADLIWTGYPGGTVSLTHGNFNGSTYIINDGYTLGQHVTKMNQ